MTTKTATKRGAPVGSMNALRNGTKLRRLTLGELPRTMRRQTQNARKYRRGLEDLVMDKHGEVSAMHAHLLDEAATAQVHFYICLWLLREKLEVMSPTDIARCSAEMMKAKTTRNKAVERLQLDEVKQMPWIEQQQHD